MESWTQNGFFTDRQRLTWRFSLSCSALFGRLRMVARQDLTIAAVLQYYADLYSDLASMEPAVDGPALGFVFDSPTAEDLERLRSAKIELSSIADTDAEVESDVDEDAMDAATYSAVTSKLSVHYQVVLHNFEESLQDVVRQAFLGSSMSMHILAPLCLFLHCLHALQPLIILFLLLSPPTFLVTVLRRRHSAFRSAGQQSGYRECIRYGTCKVQASCVFCAGCCTCAADFERREAATKTPPGVRQRGGGDQTAANHWPTYESKRRLACLGAGDQDHAAEHRCSCR